MAQENKVHDLDHFVKAQVSHDAPYGVYVWIEDSHGVSSKIFLRDGDIGTLGILMIAARMKDLV